MTYVIHCRAQVSPKCYEGRPTFTQFAEDLPMSADGTYDGDTIVCDTCYIALGMPLLADLEERIMMARAST